MLTRKTRCLACKKPFFLAQRGRPALGCSRKCKEKIIWAKRRGRPIHPPHTELRQCLWCLQLFEVINHAPQLFCNRKCYHQHNHWTHKLLAITRASIPPDVKKRLVEKIVIMLEDVG